MRTQPPTDDPTGRDFLRGVLEWAQADPGQPAAPVWMSQGRALVLCAFGLPALWRAAGVWVDAGVRRRQRIVDDLKGKDLRRLHGEMREFFEALLPRRERPITVARFPASTIGIEVARGPDGASHLTRTVTGWRAAVREVVAYAVAQNRLRRCPGCQRVFVRITMSRAGRPARFCSTACRQRMAGKHSYEKHREQRVAKQRQYRREQARARKAVQRKGGRPR